MAPNYGILDFSEKQKVMWLAGLTILKKDYPTFGPHCTKLEHS
jgi:hypothetical protein